MLPIQRKWQHPQNKMLLSSLRCSVYNKTLEYVKTFTKFNTTDSASAVRECVIPTTRSMHPNVVFQGRCGGNLL
jgi:hypothetical protein